MQSAISIVMHQSLKDSYDDEAIHIGIFENKVVRGRVKAHLSIVQKRCLVALCANAGRRMSRDSLVDACYGDNPYGGSLTAENYVTSSMMALRTVCCGLGISIDHDALGYSARLSDRPEPAASQVA
ncbi:winged helix-turn-helix domain-containing protein [Methylosinus sp. H3A]|uniref:helix-turn-helix domain-containing protein n=1 Tax=Methylosinus sp. H3A TaxID=2785786 RepID=UPI0018C23A6A|nr:helix-turn-helix domain-containing protein [Methylosinus sp. H3A]MBG0809876.1 winged helix-turn-helix domain-containing protein [Methylosinus sp. H3A]